MAESMNVGVVSLDLVIKNKISEQLDGLKSSIQRSLERTVGLAQNAAEKSASASKSAAIQSAKEVEAAEKSKKKAIDECMARIDAQRKKITEATNKAAETVKPKEVTLHINTDYEPSKVEAEVNEITQGIKDKLDGVKEKTKKVFSDFDIPHNRVDRLIKSHELIKERIITLQQQYKQLREEMSNTDDENELTKLGEKLGGVESKLLSLSDQADKTKAKIEAAMNPDDSGEPQASEDAVRVEKAVNKVGKTSERTSRTVRNVLGGAFRGAKKTADKALSGISNKFKAVSRSADSASKPVTKLFRSIKNGARRIFVMAGILSLFKSLRSALSEAANSNQQFSDSLNTVKANLAVAFQPIITAVMPMLNTLMSGVAAVTKQIAAFTSALFGTTYKKSAEAVKQAKQVGKATKEASKYLADFDEMRVHQDSSDSLSDDSQTDYSKLLDQDVKLSDWTKKLKDAIKSGDLSSVGMLLAQKVNGAFEKINWAKIREKVTKGARKAADGINGFTENLHWKEIGNSIGDGITTAFSAAYTFLKTTKWKEIGSGFAEFLNGILDKTSFTLIGRTLGAKLNAVVGLALGFVNKFNFSKAGSSLSDLINGWFDEVDWDDLGDMIGGAVQGAVEFGFSFVTKLDFEGIAKDFTTAFNKAISRLDTAKLGQTVSRAFKGVWDFIATALEEIDWEDVGAKIGDFISNIDWPGILKSIFNVIGKIIKATPKLLFGLVESLDFKGAAGLFGVLFAPKLAKSLLGKFTSDAGVAGTLGEAGSTIGSKIAAKASAAGHSFGTTLAAGATAFFAGWKIGSWLYDKFKTQFDWLGDKLGNVFCSSLNKEVEAAEERVKKAVEKTNTIAQKYEKMGYDIDYSSEKTIAESVSKAKAQQSAKNAIKTNPASQLRTTINSAYDAAAAQRAADEAYKRNASYYNKTPKLASGGIVTAPTLAYVGDNSDVRSNPEVVAPLSQLQQIMGGKDTEKYLQQIIMILETMQFVFRTDVNGRELFRTIVEQNRQYIAQTGRSAF